MKIRTGMALVGMMAALNVTTAFAQGADTYKAKCQMCHGATGMAAIGRRADIVSFIGDDAFAPIADTQGNSFFHGAEAIGAWPARRIAVGGRL